ncbi:tyrosine-type recombinase/integrase [Gottfriedia luciferensis]|uniref:tyrosine-type recombinase/integrase n=1 Tax=Gottfriedia luciferensis TaxID=178774 RepID=UPI0013028713|nr:tyrosine-type recombinase/integrase [Gottfriedia luciferensis]
MLIRTALGKVIHQMKIMGYRERTLNDYFLYVNQFADKMDLIYLTDISNEYILNWLDTMNVSSQTKLTRLKCLKAFLSRCYDNGWYSIKFWSKVNIRIDNVVKIGASEQDVNSLIAKIDISDFIGLRDTVAIMLMYQCGLRIRTLSLLEEKHIDLNNLLLRISGDILKNRQELILPFDDYAARLLRKLINRNREIRREHRESNGYVIITSKGQCVIKGTNNAIQKRLTKYTKEFGLTNINPHALRRGFAVRLRKMGADIVLISKALGHSDLAVTTKYLGVEKEEVANELRKYF